MFPGPPVFTWGSAGRGRWGRGHSNFREAPTQGQRGPSHPEHCQPSGNPGMVGPENLTPIIQSGGRIFVPWDVHVRGHQNQVAPD